MPKAKPEILPSLPQNQWVVLLAMVVGEWRQNRHTGRPELSGTKEWTPARRICLADDLLWRLRQGNGAVWLAGAQLCVQPKELASYFAPLIRALKPELVMLLSEL